jgi:DNA repair protein RecO (recombination protein O)
MLVKTEAILLRKTLYADNSAILHIYTKTHGLQSFIAQGLHGKTSKAALLQQGNLLELIFYFQPNKALKRIKEMQLMQGFKGFDQNPVRLQILIFCLELGGKCIPEEQEDPHTFEFLKMQFIDLSITQELTWFPLRFMIEFAKICGLALQLPAGDESAGFQLETGQTVFRHTGMNPLQHLDETEMRICKSLQHNLLPQFGIAERRNLIEKLLYYFKVHLFPDQELKSFPILMEVLG